MVSYELTNLEQCLEISTPYLGKFSTKTADTAIPKTSLFEYSTTLTDLKPYSSYVISVTSWNVTDMKTITNAVAAQTAEAGERFCYHHSRFSNTFWYNEPFFIFNCSNFCLNRCFRKIETECRII